VDDELLAYLRRCLTSVKGPVMQPEIPVFLNDLLSMEDLRGGTEPMMGDRHLRTLSVDGFPARRIPAHFRCWTPCLASTAGTRARS